jgi:hypothetical protein
MTDLIIREVPGRGWLPIIEVDGKETYRGEFKKTPALALKACVARLGK